MGGAVHGSANEGVAPVATTAMAGMGGGGENGGLSKPYEPEMAGRRGSRDNSGGANGNVGNGFAASENADGHENGEITASSSNKPKREDGEAEAEQRPPKEDVMVDYTDEFGRVRTMLQRCALSLLFM